MEEYGGVCGMIGRQTTGACQARGIPAMPVGQPGHCALAWAKPLSGNTWKWQLYNDISGLSATTRHDGIKTPWLERNVGQRYKGWRNIWTVWVYDKNLENIDNFIQSILENPVIVPGLSSVSHAKSQLSAFFLLGSPGYFFPNFPMMLNPPSPLRIRMFES